MSSVILTKVNTVTPRNFGQQIEWMQGHGDQAFLKEFVNYLHGKQKGTAFEHHFSTIAAHTVKRSYKYTVYPKHIVRTDVNTTKKKFYQIS